MYSDEVAIAHISSFLVNGTKHPKVLGRKWKKIVSFVFSVLYRHEAANWALKH